MIIHYIKWLMSKRKLAKELNAANLYMEKLAQKNVEARLTRLELAYKNKTRTK